MLKYNTLKYNTMKYNMLKYNMLKYNMQPSGPTQINGGLNLWKSES